VLTSERAERVFKLLKVKWLVGHLRRLLRRESLIPKPLGTVTQPTLSFKCYSPLASVGQNDALRHQQVGGKPLLALNWERGHVTLPSLLRDRLRPH